MSIPLLAAALALADPGRALLRVDEPIHMQRYKLLRGEGPVQGRWRHRAGEHRVYYWPDRVAEHIDTWDGRRIATRRRFGYAGNPLTTTSYADGVPGSVVVHTLTDDEVAVGDWRTVELGGATLRVPPGGETDGPVQRWVTDASTLTLQLSDAPGDPTTDAYTSALQTACRCEVVDRVPTWIGGRVAVRHRVRYAHPTHAQVGEVWAIPARGGHLVLAVVTGQGDQASSHLAIGRAVAALVEWEGR